MTTDAKPLGRVFLGFSFLIGIILAILSHFGVDSLLCYLWIGLFASLFLLSYEQATSVTRLLVSSIIISFLCAMPFTWPNTGNSTALCFLSIANAYALNAFHIAYQTNHLKLKYHTLFYAVWDTFGRLIIAGFFTALCWGILLLWGSLFSLISISFFQTLFSKSWFIIWSLSFFMGIGLYISIITKQIARNLRHVLLLICRYLLPILAIIGLLFIAGWLIKIVILHDTFKADVFWFLSFSILSIIFINGVYQIGEITSPYPKILLFLTNSFIIVTPIFTLISLYALSTSSTQSIQKTGLNANNFNLALLTVILLLYNLSYAIIACRRQAKWLNAIGNANISLAAALIIIALATNNPLFIQTDINPGLKQSTITHYTVPIQKSYQEKIEIMKQASVQWVGYNLKTPPKNALILGFNPNPIYACRTKIKDSYKGGVIINQACQTVEDGSIKSDVFEILTGESKPLAWRPFNQSYQNQLSPIVSGWKNQSLLGICRTIYDNHIVVGVSLKQSCLIMVNGRLKKMSGYQHAKEYLYIHQ